MKIGVLFSGGKDSCLAAWLAKKEGYDLACLISIDSRNKESFMFHTPSISKVEKQSEAMGIPLILYRTEGEKENPLWQKSQFEILEDLVKNNFEVVVSGVFAYPLEQDFLGRVIDEDFIEDMKSLRDKYKINPAGEGGEFESFVLSCPLFEKSLKIKGFQDFGEGNSWRREVEI
jgi:diphthine-ammonia ligase